MVDTLLLHHYQRLWKAEATREILETRPQHHQRNLSSSVMNLCNSPYLPKRASMSNLNYATVPKQQQMRQKRRYFQKRSEPQHRQATTAASSSEDETLMRKAISMHDLHAANGKIAANSASDEELSQLKMADKIDSFLETVSKQQDALSKLMEQRRTRRTSVNSRMSSLATVQRKNVSNSSILTSTSTRPQTVASSASRALKKSSSVARPKSAAVIGQKRVLDKPPAYDATKVTSRLTQDRNYQPPRRKPQPVQKAISKELASQETQKTSIVEADDDYGEEDFEEDEEDDDTDHLVAKKKEAWLYDQAVRGRARQKAAEALKSSLIQEKESSKDSAYGFSGGENSRLHTREPTPDANNYHIQPRIINHYKGHSSRGPPPPVSQNATNRRKQFLSSLGTTPVHRRFDGHPKPSLGDNRHRKPINHLVDRGDTEKVEFLNKVTREILRRGVFTEKAIRRALDSDCSNYARNENITVNEKVALMTKLKEDLGFEKGSNARKMVRSTSESSSLSSLHPPAANGSNNAVKEEVVEDDDSLSSLLMDESDQDLVALLKSVLREEKSVQPKPRKSPPKIVENTYASPETDEEDSPRRKLPIASKSPGKLFESLNLSNLNVSFNSSSMADAKRRLNESRTQALLVKSFAYKDDLNKRPKPPLQRSRTTVDDGKELTVVEREKAEAHSENDSVQDDLIPSEEREESLGSNSEAASAIEDEDIPYESDLD